MNKLSPFIAGGALFLAACSPGTNPESSGKTAEFPKGTVAPQVEIAWSADFPADKKVPVRSTMDKYIKLYGCASHRITMQLGSFAARQESDGSRTTALATSTPGNITFNTSELKKRKDTQVQDTTAHEMTHACKQSTQTMFEKPIMLDDGVKALGSLGFMVLVELPDGTSTKFVAIEEGLAEAEAAAMRTGYATEDKGYFNVGNLTQKLAKDHNLTGQQLSKMQQSNDLQQFVTRVGDPSLPFETNLVNVARQYSQAFNDI